MRISQLAARTGVPASTLRFYEAEVLLPADRADNGYRVYGEGAVDRLAFIAQAKHLDRPRSELPGAPRVDVAGGVRVTLPTSALERTAALAAAEQDCCGFYAFRIDLHGATFDLTITAPPEARAMLDDLLPTGETATR